MIEILNQEGINFIEPSSRKEVEDLLKANPSVTLYFAQVDLDLDTVVSTIFDWSNEDLTRDQVDELLSGYSLYENILKEMTDEELTDWITQDFEDLPVWLIGKDISGGDNWDMEETGFTKKEAIEVLKEDYLTQEGAVFYSGRNSEEELNIDDLLNN